ncbi:MAG TPA: MarR family transcriptional regulator [Actinomycetes bacterium]|nr:MarR family transcriptional regulator [Actinomycetes bacterium]
MSETPQPGAEPRPSPEAREIWELLIELSASRMRQRFSRTIAELRLSPPQAHALRQLEPDQPLPMRDLAGSLACDASNVTGIADRLEKRGLVERQVSSSDRRVKTLVVTPEGVATRKRLLALLHEVPAPIAMLSPGEQRLLRDVLRRILEAPDEQA